MGSIFCIGQSAYDITIPLDGAICENQKYRVTQKEECGADFWSFFLIVFIYFISL